MSNPIPPLLCCTPPPIDFTAESNIDDNDFGEFAVADSSSIQLENYDISLPVTPIHEPTSRDSIETESLSQEKDDEFCVVQHLSVHSNPPSPDLCSDEHQTIEFEKEESLPSLQFNLTEPISRDNLAAVGNEVKIEDVGSEDEFSAFEGNATNISLENDDYSITYKNDLTDFKESQVVEELYKKDLADFKESNVEELNDQDLPKSEDDFDAKFELKNEILEDSGANDKSNIDENVAVEENVCVVSEQIQITDESNIVDFEELQTETCIFQSYADNTISTELSSANTIQETSNEFVFEADFSQFAAFEASDAPSISVMNEETPVEIEKSSVDDFDEDDFDDFQDFTQPPLDTPIPSVEDDVDDFGEFNDFEQAPVATNVSLEPIDGKILPLLEVMFPTESKDCQETVTTSITNDINVNLKQIDCADALQYQWNSSNMKNCLVTSLGIDTRNILYGEKWNSSMPRFAANLSFNPLEPMKPTKVGDSSNTSGVTERGNVPEVEFDWNTSGLVNPLDASQAHTLLLDLDQLVVVASLDKIKLDSSSCSSPFSSTNAQLTTMATTPSTTDSNYDQCLQRFNDLLDGYWNQSHKNLGKSTTNSNKLTTIKCTNHINANIGIDHLSINQNLDCRSKEIVREGKTKNIHPPESGDNDQHSEQQQQQKPSDETTAAATITPKITTSNLSALDVDLTIDLSGGPCSNDNDKYVEKTNNDLSEISEAHSTSTFSGPLKETHIFTPSKNEVPFSSRSADTAESKKCPDFDYEMAAAGIIIDETVVKKEYRDVEYNPGFELSTTPQPMKDPEYLYRPPENVPVRDILENAPDNTKSELQAENIEDEFSEFQSVPVPPPTQVNENKPSPTNWPKLKETGSRNTSRTGTPISICDEMILSPAVLLPQSVQIDSAPKIEWPEPGINPEELARFDEIFAKPSPSHSKPTNSNNLSISQTIAEQESSKIDDEDWSDFVSVPVVTNHNLSQAQHFPKAPSISSSSQKKSSRNPSIEDEWSEFVSSTPVPQSSMPQFNSAAWQNANFYNNPLSAYSSTYYHSTVPNNPMMTNLQGNVNNNNQFVSNMHHLQHSQTNANQIQIMQDFSTVPRQATTMPQSQSIAKNKIAPSISLIPDLGFVAPQQSRPSTFINIPKHTLQPRK